MNTATAPLTANELGLSVAIPEGIDPSEVARRTKEFLRCGAADGRTLNGKILAETMALQAATMQAQVDRREADKAAAKNAQFLQGQRELAAATLPEGGDLAATLARMDGEPLRELPSVSEPVIEEPAETPARAAAR